MAKLKCSPTCARLIIINTKKHGQYQIIPGGEVSKWVTVHEDVLKEPFVQCLIDNGILIAGAGVAAEKSEQEELQALRAECKEKGIRYNGKNKAEKLRELIAIHDLQE